MHIGLILNLIKFNLATSPRRSPIKFHISSSEDSSVDEDNSEDLPLESNYYSENDSSVEFNFSSDKNSVDLRKKSLRKVPRSVYSMKNLQKLDLSHNLLESVPVEIMNLKELDELLLENNNLETIPAEISNLQSLVYLGLENNNLKYLPRSLERMPSIYVLNIKDNPSLPLHVEDFDKLGLVELHEIFHYKLMSDSIDFQNGYVNLEEYFKQLSERPLYWNRTMLARLKTKSVKKTVLNKKRMESIIEKLVVDKSNSSNFSSTESSFSSNFSSTESSFSVGSHSNNSSSADSHSNNSSSADLFLSIEEKEILIQFITNLHIRDIDYERWSVPYFYSKLTINLIGNILEELDNKINNNWALNELYDSIKQVGWSLPSCYADERFPVNNSNRVRWTFPPNNKVDWTFSPNNKVDWTFSPNNNNKQVNPSSSIENKQANPSSSIENNSNQISWIQSDMKSLIEAIKNHPGNKQLAELRNVYSNIKKDSEIDSIVEEQLASFRNNTLEKTSTVEENNNTVEKTSTVEENNNTVEKTSTVEENNNTVEKTSTVEENNDTVRNENNNTEKETKTEKRVRIHRYILNRIISLKEIIFGVTANLINLKKDQESILDYWKNHCSDVLGVSPAEYPSSDPCDVLLKGYYNSFMSTFFDYFTPEYAIKSITKDIHRNLGIRRDFLEIMNSKEEDLKTIRSLVRKFLIDNEIIIEN